MNKRAKSASKPWFWLGLLLFASVQILSQISDDEQAGAQKIVSAAEMSAAPNTTDAAKSTPDASIAVDTSPPAGGSTMSPSSTEEALPPKSDSETETLPPVSTPTLPPVTTVNPPAGTPTPPPVSVISPTPSVILSPTPNAIETPQPTPAVTVSITPTPGGEPDDALSGSATPKPSESPEKITAAAEWELDRLGIRKELNDFFKEYLIDEQLIALCSAQLEAMNDDPIAQLYIDWKTGGKSPVQFVAQCVEKLPKGAAAEPSQTKTPLSFNREFGAGDYITESFDGKTVTMYADSYGKYRVDLQFQIQNNSTVDKKLSMLLMQDTPWIDSAASVGFSYYSKANTNFYITCNDVVLDQSEFIIQEDESGELLLFLAPQTATAIIAPGSAADICISYWVQGMMSPAAGVRSVNISQVNKFTQCMALLGSVNEQSEITTPDPELESLVIKHVFGEPLLSLPAQATVLSENPYHVFRKSSLQTLEIAVAVKKTARNFAELSVATASEYTITDLPAAWLDVSKVITNYKFPQASVFNDDGVSEELEIELQPVVHDASQSSITIAIPVEADGNTIEGQLQIVPILDELNTLTSKFMIASVSPTFKVTLEGKDFAEQKAEFDVITVYEDVDGNTNAVHVPFILSQENAYKNSIEYIVPSNLIGSNLKFTVYAPYWYETETREIDFTKIESGMITLAAEYFEAHPDSVYNPDGFTMFVNEKLLNTPGDIEVNLSVRPTAKPWIRAWSFLGMLRQEMFLEERRPRL